MIRIAGSGLLGIALMCATVGLSTPQHANATSFAHLTVDQFTDASTWIVEGRVTRVWSELDPEDAHKVWTRAEVEVDAVHKGPGTPERIVIDSLGGRYGDTFLAISGRAVFSPGERLFAFLDTVDQGRRLTPVSMFQGKLTVRRAAGETRKHVLQVHPKSSPDYEFDHRFLPHPPPEQRIYLDDLRAKVLARVQVGWDGQPIPGISNEKLAEINDADPSDIINPGAEVLR